MLKTSTRLSRSQETKKNTTTFFFFFGWVMYKSPIHGDLYYLKYPQYKDTFYSTHVEILHSFFSIGEGKSAGVISGNSFLNVKNRCKEDIVSPTPPAFQVIGG